MSFLSRWFNETAGMVRLRSFMPFLEDAGAWPMEVPNKALRQALRNYLPLPGNWFARWKWVIIAVIVIKLIVMSTRMMGRAVN